MMKGESYWVKKLNAVQSTKYPDRWDVKGDVILSNGNLTKLPLQFGIVTGFFHCSYNKLESLEGSPIEVGGNFFCPDNELSSLKGLPTYIGGDLYFSDNPLEHLNDLINVKIERYIFINSYINALYNTNLDALEYTLNNHKYWFDNNNDEKEFYMNLEQIIIRKRLELLLV